MKRFFTLTIELENEAFQADPACALSRLLLFASQELALDGFPCGEETEHGFTRSLLDFDGNWCGQWRAMLDEDAPCDPHRLDPFSQDELQALHLALVKLASNRSAIPGHRTLSRAAQTLARQVATELDYRNS